MPLRLMILHLSHILRTLERTFTMPPYLARKVIRPRERSYGDNSTFTLSPGRIRMKFIRIFPEIWARIRCPFSNSTRKVALGSVSRTVPSTSIGSSLGATWSVSPALFPPLRRYVQNDRIFFHPLFSPSNHLEATRPRKSPY